MIFKHAVPILYCTDVAKSLTYYTEVLGFCNKWDWGKPPTFGGVSKDAVEIYFSKKGQGNPGTWLSIMVDNVDEYYEHVKAKGATILSEPKNMEWGIREMLLEDPDGHMIRFGQASPVSDRERSAMLLPPNVRIVDRPPTQREKERIEASLGWTSNAKKDKTEKPLSPAVVFAVVAEDSTTGQAIGCAFVIGDEAGFYYIKDVMVHGAWHGKRIGTVMMQALSEWMEKNAPPNSSAWLHTRENLATFYRQFGFAPVYGMYRQLRK